MSSPSNSEQEEDSSCVSYESDYEYNDEDEEDCEDYVCKECSPVKTADSETTTLATSNTYSKSDVKDFDWQCDQCHREAHVPLRQCAKLDQWLQLTEEMASGVFMVSPSQLQPVLDARIQEAHRILQAVRNLAKYNLTINDAGLWDLSEYDIAGELQYHRWNVKQWLAAKHRLARARQQAEWDRRIQEAKPPVPHPPDKQKFHSTPVAATGVPDVEAQEFDQLIEACQEQKLPDLGKARATSPDDTTTSMDDTSSTQDSSSSCCPETPERLSKRTCCDSVCNCLTRCLKRKISLTSDMNSGDADVLMEPLLAKSPSPTVAAVAPPTSKADEQDLDRKPAATKRPKVERSSWQFRDLLRHIDSQPQESTPVVAAPVVSSPRTASGVNSTTNNNNPPIPALPTEEESDSSFVCEICLDMFEAEDELWTLPTCGHTYCRHCWTGYLQRELVTAQALNGIYWSIFCPSPGCRYRLHQGHIQELLPDQVAVFQAWLFQTFVQGNSMLRWCPGPDCGHIAVRPREGLLFHHDTAGLPPVHCGHCETTFCWECGEAPHPGNPCLAIRLADGTANAREEGAVVEQEVVERTAQQEALKSADHKIRQCPSCNVPIEKNGGCNIMRCLCSHRFCWLCLADVSGPNGHSHFCGRERKQRQTINSRRGRNDRTLEFRPLDMEYITDILQKSLGTVELMDEKRAICAILQHQQILQRFAHYYNRYTAHGQGQFYAENQCECLEGRADQFKKISDLKSGTDTDFFLAANERLVASRRILKYTYCYAYYKIPFKGIDIDNLLEGKACEDPDKFVDNECPMDDAVSSNLPLSFALFLDHQERLERVTEQLSFLSESALTRNDRQRVVDMIDTIDRCMKAVAVTSREVEASSALGL